MKTLKFKLTGTAGLLLHNGQLADPGNNFTQAIKKISGKRKKVDADFEEMARLEFLGGLYTNNGNVVIPGFVIEASLIGRGGAARSEKMGRVAASSVFIPEDSVLEYDGPKTPDKLWEDESFRHKSLVKVGQARIMRTRPYFAEWTAETEVLYNPDVVDREMVIHWMEYAGDYVGLCDWRPRFGRFDTELIDES